jgi:hypothetical protein|tara:strand:- start:585 stop:785 length:201 start_codon:yes stop_codon:yes gene_type:complete
VETAAVLDLSAMRPPLLDDLPEAEAAGTETGSNVKLDNNLALPGGTDRRREPWDRLGEARRPGNCR